MSAKVAVYLKDSLGASTRYLTKFTQAVSQVPGFAGRILGGHVQGRTVVDVNL